MKALLFVGMGGFLGAAGRYLLSGLVQSRSGAFPTATLLVNLLGCLLIGLLFGLAERSAWSGPWRMLLFPGLLGGFTTFSAFSFESQQLIRTGEWAMALVYILLSVLGGLALVFLGSWAVGSGQ